MSTKVVRYTGKVMRHTDETKLPELIEWCRDYTRYTQWPCKYDKRFAIGLYQIWTGIGWQKSGHNVAEAYMGAALHFIMTLEACNLHPESGLPNDLMELVELGDPSWKQVMIHISRAQQHLLYRAQLYSTGGTVLTNRSSRYNPQQLQEDLCSVIYHLVCGVKKEWRRGGIIDATVNMTTL